MPFGKYKGREVCTLPESYLRWLSTSGVIRTKELSNEVDDCLANADDGDRDDEEGAWWHPGHPSNYGDH